MHPGDRTAAGIVEVLERRVPLQGYGAGASVTAAGVFADIISIANVTN